MTSSPPSSVSLQTLPSAATAAKRTFRFHVLGIAHLPATKKYMSCAFTQKIHKLCEMLLAKGHHVILYAAEGSDAPCSEFVQTHSVQQIRAQYGDPDYDGPEEIGYDWRSEQYRHDFGEHNKLTGFVRHIQIAQIELRKQPDDFLLLTMGCYHKPVADACGLYLQVESGIGYYGSYAPFRVYESYAIRHLSRGGENKGAAVDGMNYYTVIPNYYRLQDFDFVAAPAGDAEDSGEPYFLFIGRIIQRKGIEIAIEATKQADVKLIIAGQGGKYDAATHTFYVDGQTFHLTKKQTFFGFADCETRKKLMGNAVATISPTIFMEPFCGVSAETQLCGTPAITTDFGAFAENVEQGRTGYRCRSINDFVLAIKNAHRLDRQYICQRAQALWSCEAVNEQYEKYWHDLHDVYLSTLKHEPDEHGKTRQYGFYQIRTAEEEAAAGTAEWFVAPRQSYESRAIVHNP